MAARDLMRDKEAVERDGFQALLARACRLPPLLVLQPALRHLAHGLGRAIVNPGHEFAIETEPGAALLNHEAPDILGVSISAIDRRVARDGIVVPVECHAVSTPAPKRFLDLLIGLELA